VPGGEQRDDLVAELVVVQARLHEHRQDVRALGQARVGAAVGELGVDDLVDRADALGELALERRLLDGEAEDLRDALPPGGVSAWRMRSASSS
jgi:hypothetical protein